MTRPIHPRHRPPAGASIVVHIPAGRPPDARFAVAQSATQWRNIEAATGLTLEDFSASMRAAGLERHGEMVAWLKDEHGLTHGNANLVALRVREAGGGRYPGRAGSARCAVRGCQGSDAARVRAGRARRSARRTGCACGHPEDRRQLRRARQFALVQAPSAKRVTLGLNLDATPDDRRITAVTGMCSHLVELPDPASVDDVVAGWSPACLRARGLRPSSVGRYSQRNQRAEMRKQTTSQPASTSASTHSGAYGHAADHRLSQRVAEVGERASAPRPAAGTRA